MELVTISNYEAWEYATLRCLLCVKAAMQNRDHMRVCACACVNLASVAAQRSARKRDRPCCQFCWRQAKPFSRWHHDLPEFEHLRQAGYRDGIGCATHHHDTAQLEQR